MLRFGETILQLWTPTCAPAVAASSNKILKLLLLGSPFSISFSGLKFYNGNKGSLWSAHLQAIRRSQRGFTDEQESDKVFDRSLGNPHLDTIASYKSSVQDRNDLSLHQILWMECSLHHSWTSYSKFYTNFFDKLL